MTARLDFRLVRGPGSIKLAARQVEALTPPSTFARIYGIIGCGRNRLPRNVKFVVAPVARRFSSPELPRRLVLVSPSRTTDPAAGRTARQSIP